MPDILGHAKIMLKRTWTKQKTLPSSLIKQITGLSIVASGSLLLMHHTDKDAHSACVPSVSGMQWVVSQH